MTDPSVQHADYSANRDVWRRCRDAAAGQRAIKAGREQYLLRLSGQDDLGYLSYLDRAVYFNATGRTLDAMVGMAFRKPMTVEVPASVEPWLDDITLADETLSDLAQTLLTETILTDRCAILVEQPKATDQPQTLADKEATSTRAYLVVYKTESIINWEYKRVGNRYRLVNVWLSEKYRDDAGEEHEQVRQLTLNSGFYQQIIWRKVNGANWAIADTITPTKNGTALIDIPFYPVTSGKPTLEIGAPMIESMADINIGHFKNSADRENGAHFAGLPLLWVACDGIDPDETTVHVGSQTALVLPSSKAKVAYAQVGSEGFSTLKELMIEKEQQMAALGARMLSPEKKQAEASETHEIKRGGENAVLSSVCGTVERQITAALTFAAEWEGIAGEISIELNRDFFPVQFTGVDALNWMKVWQGGGMSKQYLFDLYKYSEWLPDDATFEEMQAQIEEEGPALSALEQPAADDGAQ